MLGSFVGKNVRKGKLRKFVRLGEEKKKDLEKVGVGSIIRDLIESKDIVIELVL